MIITYGKQEITDEDIDKVSEVLRSSFLTQGPAVLEFEKSVAKKHNAKYAVAFSNGTTALHGCYNAIGIKEGDSVISPAITFAATSNAAIYCGADVNLCDIDLDTYCINIEEIEKLITENTRAIAAVSMGGYPLDLQSIKEIAKIKNIPIIFDAAHAICSNRDGEFGLSHADLAILSFHPVKHVATGEGGMVLTNNKKYYDKLVQFRTHGITKDTSKFKNQSDGEWYYEMQTLGNNYRMCDILASLGTSQFSRIDKNIFDRNEIASNYRKDLKHIDSITLPPAAPVGSTHSYHLFIILLPDHSTKSMLYKALKEKNIFTQVHYVPLNYMPYYQEKFGYQKGDFPNAEKYYDRALSLPMYHSMTKKEYKYIIECIHEILG